MKRAGEKIKDGDLRVWNDDCPVARRAGQVFIVLRVWDPAPEQGGEPDLGCWMRYMCAEEVGELPSTIIELWSHPAPLQVNPSVPE